MIADDSDDRDSHKKPRIKNREGKAYRLLRSLYYGINNVTLPIPRSLCMLFWHTNEGLTKLYYWLKSTFVVTPLYKGLCSQVGKDFRGGTFIPYVSGRGRITVGEGAKFYGKQTFLFASIRDETPTVNVGNRTSIGHNTVFDIAGTLVIGEHCLIASGVTFQDCSGHSIIPNRRALNEPPQPKDVRDIRIGNNVWIGTGAFILPGATIGDNCVIASNTTVSRRIPSNSLVYAAQPKVLEIRDISRVI